MTVAVGIPFTMVNTKPAYILSNVKFVQSVNLFILLHLGFEGSHIDLFEIFESSKYGRRNLIFTDTTQELYDVGERNTYYSWVGE